jgi:glucose-1-phosphate thymidylyltransferase
MNCRGIILAGGKGSRLYPITEGVSKQLLPVYDKPMIYYPLSVLMLSGIQDILIITTPEDQSQYQRLLGTGEDFGLSLQYAVQSSPGGLAESFLIGKDFISDNNVCLILGDNIFYGQGFSPRLRKAQERETGATIFGYHVLDPERFGVVEFDEYGKVLSIEEKPTKPKSSFAVTGLYFYDSSVVEIAEGLRPSRRGELEVTDVNRIYLERNELHVELLGRGFAWLDVGTHDSLIAAGQFVQTVEQRQGFKIGCLEEIGLLNGWLTSEQVHTRGVQLANTSYGNYLCDIVKIDFTKN